VYSGRSLLAVKKETEKKGRGKDGRKEGKSRGAIRTCIYSERLLDGARQGEREIKRREKDSTGHFPRVTVIHFGLYCVNQ